MLGLALPALRCLGCWLFAVLGRISPRRVLDVEEDLFNGSDVGRELAGAVRILSCSCGMSRLLRLPRRDIFSPLASFFIELRRTLSRTSGPTV